MGLNIKRIRDRVTKMNRAWKQSAPTAVFMGITQSAFEAEITAAAALEEEIATMEAAVQAKKRQRDTSYQKLNDDSVRVRQGVEGDVNFGTNHPLYDLMGFTTDDDRESGLTRKKTDTPDSGT
jgi:hypothetical protein